MPQKHPPNKQQRSHQQTVLPSPAPGLCNHRLCQNEGNPYKEGRSLQALRSIPLRQGTYSNLYATTIFWKGLFCSLSQVKPVICSQQPLLRPQPCSLFLREHPLWGTAQVYPDRKQEASFWGLPLYRPIPSPIAMHLPQLLSLPAALA